MEIHVMIQIFWIIDYEISTQHEEHKKLFTSAINIALNDSSSYACTTEPVGTILASCSNIFPARPSVKTMASIGCILVC